MSDDVHVAATAAAEQAMQDQRPLSAAAGRNLLKIVKNDFEQIKANIHTFAREEIDRRQKEATPGATPERIDELREQAQQLRQEIGAKMREFRQKLFDTGLDWNVGDGIPAIAITDRVLSQRKNNIVREVQKERDLALATAEREYLKAERLVLMATITPQAEEILSGIPTAESLMAAAYAERTKALP